MRHVLIQKKEEKNAFRKKVKQTLSDIPMSIAVTDSLHPDFFLLDPPDFLLAYRCVYGPICGVRIRWLIINH